MHGVARDLQHLICLLILGISLHRRLEGYIETLPHSGQWDAVRLVAYEVFLWSEKEGFCHLLRS